MSAYLKALKTAHKAGEERVTAKGVKAVVDSIREDEPATTSSQNLCASCMMIGSVRVSRLIIGSRRPRAATVPTIRRGPSGQACEMMVTYV